MVRGSGATDGDEPVFPQILYRFARHGFREKEGDGGAVRLHTDTPGSGGFGHERGIPGPHHDGDAGLQQLDHL